MHEDEKEEKEEDDGDDDNDDEDEKEEEEKEEEEKEDGALQRHFWAQFLPNVPAGHTGEREEMVRRRKW